MRMLRQFGVVLAGLCLTWLCLAWPALADDTLRIAVGQRGLWDTSVAELGQRAGIFKKHGIALEILYTQGGGETQQAVISGSVDLGASAGVLGVFGAFAKGAPLRIIGAEITGAADLFWYVQSNSPIHSLADTDGRTIAYSTTGSSSHLIALSFIRANGLFARSVATGGPAATFTQVMSGQIDVGWSSPPFGLDAVADGRIRIVARGNDLPEFRDQTIRLIVANAGFLERRKDAAARYVQGYRDALDWMYSDPTALDAYAQFANTSAADAREVRDLYYPRDHLQVDHIAGLDAVMRDGIAFRYIAQPLTKEQLGGLIQIPAPIK